MDVGGVEKRNELGVWFVLVQVQALLQEQKPIGRQKGKQYRTSNLL